MLLLNTGSDECMQCGEGEFQDLEGQTSCKKCQRGEYADRKGSEVCTSCPYPLSSADGSKICAYCRKDFFLNRTTFIKEEVVQNPLKYCKSCPTHAICPENTTILNLGIEPGYRRLSNNTSQLYSCRSNTTCVGYTPSNPSSIISMNDLYCAEDLKGPLCESCKADSFYFNEQSEKCEKCPSNSRLALRFLWLSTVIALTAAISYYIISYYLSEVLSDLSILPKAKLFITFYQLISSLKVVYGVQITLDWAWANAIFASLSFDMSQRMNQLLPNTCIYKTVRSRLVANSLYPYLIILSLANLVILLAIYRQCKIMRGSRSLTDRQSLSRGSFGHQSLSKN